MIKIELANCCSCCEHTLVPKQHKKKIAEHAAHYEVAKTLRWCYKHNVHTVCEGICEDFQFRKNSAGVKAIQMAHRRNEVLSEIRRLIDFMAENDIKFLISLEQGPKIYFPIGNKIYYWYNNLLKDNDGRQYIVNQVLSEPENITYKYAVNTTDGMKHIEIMKKIIDD